MTIKKKVLGKGLASLIPSRFSSSQELMNSGAPQERVIEVEIEKIKSNPHQPRQTFDNLDQEELVASIKENGILQPLIVTRIPGGYELIAGERRLRAAKILDLKTVPAIVRKASDQRKLELALIENIQRRDLNPIEQARAYQKLLDDFHLTQEEIAKRVGKSRSLVTNTLRLLTLPSHIQRAIGEGKINFSQAKLILSLTSPSEQNKLYQKIIRSGLTVRETEKKIKKVKVKSHLRDISQDLNLRDKAEQLQGFLGTKVKIDNKNGQGKILIDFYSPEELNEIIKKIIK